MDGSTRPSPVFMRLEAPVRMLVYPTKLPESIEAKESTSIWVCYFIEREIGSDGLRVTESRKVQLLRRL